MYSKKGGINYYLKHPDKLIRAIGASAILLQSHSICELLMRFLTLIK